MEELEVKKYEPEFKSEGWTLYATDNSDLQIMEWDDLCAGRLAWALHMMLKRHALSTNGVQRFFDKGVVVRRLEYIDVAVVVKASQSDSALQFLGHEGNVLEKDDLERLPGVRKNRIPIMEDVSLHTARSLRAYLAALDIHEFELKLHFGIAPDMSLLLQVPNPLECSFGTTDYEAICGRLGDI